MGEKCFVAYYYDSRRFPRGAVKLGDCEWATLRDVRKMILQTAQKKANPGQKVALGKDRSKKPGSGGGGGSGGRGGGRSGGRGGRATLKKGTMGGEKKRKR